MTTLTQPLRDEHQELLPHIEKMRTVADQIGEYQTDDFWQAIDSVYDFLAHHLIPHAEAEDHALYPVVARAMGAPQATATMSRDHTEVGAFFKELAALRSELNGHTLNQTQMKTFRRLLYGLYALVKVHFAKEEEIYLPLLDSRLTPAEARRLFETLEQAAHEAKAHPVG